MVLVTADADRPFDDARFTAHHVLSEPVLLAVPAGHPLSTAAAPVRLASLESEAWIAGSAAPEATLLAPSVRLGFRPRIAFVAGEWTAKLGFVAAGLGVTLVPALAARAAPPDVTLLALHPDEFPSRSVLATTIAGRTVPPAVTDFLTILRTEATEFLAPARRLPGASRSNDGPGSGGRPRDGRVCAIPASAARAAVRAQRALGVRGENPPAGPAAKRWGSELSRSRQAGNSGGAASYRLLRSINFARSTSFGRRSADSAVPWARCTDNWMMRLLPASQPTSAPGPVVSVAGTGS